MLTALHSVVVEVEDLVAATRDFAGLLGVRAEVVPVPPGGAASGAIFRLRNARLELREAPRSGAGASPREGIAGLRLAGRFGAGTGLVPGPVAGPTVPIELVPERSGDVGMEADGSRAATDTAGDDASITGLDHVVVATGDPERLRRFFVEELGLRLALDRSFPERGLRLLFFRLGGVTIEVAAAIAAGTPAGAGPDRFHGLAWKVDRLDAVHARLSAAGFALSAIRPGHKPGTRVCTVDAPVHGVPTLLIEHGLVSSRLPTDARAGDPP